VEEKATMKWNVKYEFWTLTLISDGAVTGFIIDPQSGGHFCYWKNSASGANKWALSRYNNPPDPIQPFNYVDRVCQEVK
jgi:hypothetical protein